MEKLTPTELAQEDEKLLREYLDKTFGGLRGDRSTASYALEFLKTTRNNWDMATKRADLTAAAVSLEYFGGWCKDTFARMEAVNKELAKREAEWREREKVNVPSPRERDLTWGK